MKYILSGVFANADDVIVVKTSFGLLLLFFTMKYRKFNLPFFHLQLFLKLAIKSG